MPSRETQRQLAAVLLVATAIALAIAGLWTARQRTLIPQALAHHVVERELRHEKHPGRDDVHVLFLTTGSGPRVEQRVAREVYEAAEPGSELRKGAGDRTLEIRLGTKLRSLELEPSGDSRGWARLLLLILILLALALAVERRINRAP